MRSLESCVIMSLFSSDKRWQWKRDLETESLRGCGKCEGLKYLFIIIEGMYPLHIPIKIKGTVMNYFFIFPILLGLYKYYTPSTYIYRNFVVWSNPKLRKQHKRI